MASSQPSYTLVYLAVPVPVNSKGKESCAIESSKNKCTNDSNKIKCTECDRLFGNISNLRRHLRKMHPDKVHVVAPFRRKRNRSDFSFPCDFCSRNFSKERNLRYHLKSHKEKELELGNSSVGESDKKNSKKCPLCSFCDNKTEEMFKHFEHMHQIIVNHEDMEFTSICDFDQWLKKFEKTTQSRFVKKSTKAGKKSVMTMYTCHRSGMYVPEGKGLRSLKLKGSVKINGFCPASIKLLQNNNGECNVHKIETHVGHSSDTNLDYLFLTKEEKQKLASQIASKVPFDDILDGVRNSTSNSEPERIHLLRRKDLYNIEKCFKLTNSVRHSNGAVGIDAWVNEMRRENDCVLFYKPQGTMLGDHLWLKSEDFVLMIMTSAQCELLKKYGEDCICLDRIRGPKSHNFELHTLLVLEGYPCAFCISNCTHQEVLKSFFRHVKRQAGIISPKVFMSDVAESCFNAWIDVMGAPEKRFFSTWDVDRNWRNNLPKIKSKEKQVVIYKQLRTLLQERDSAAFHEKIDKFCETCSEDQETQDFSKYFTNHYYSNYECWAYSYRLHSGINTNTNLEHMHKTIKCIYLEGKNIQSVDKTVSAIMRFVRNKLVDKLIVISMGTIIKNLQSRHKTSDCLDLNLIVTSESGWEVPSEKGNEMYLIQELNQTCTCQLICSKCDICIHKYCCSCVDYTIKFNMCKHIHLLANWRKRDRFNNGNHQNIGDDLEDSNLSIHMDSQPSDDEVDVIAQNKEKAEIKQRFFSLVDSVESPTQLEIVNKCVTSLSLLLSDLNNIKTENPTVKPDNTNTTGCLRSTNKKRRIS